MKISLTEIKKLNTVEYVQLIKRYELKAEKLIQLNKKNNRK